MTHIPQPNALLELVFERALRIRIWNELRERGVSQDEAIRQINAEIERLKQSATNHHPSGGEE